MLNQVQLIGHLGQDPELRNTGGGTPVANLRLATNDRRKDKDGNWQDVTEWHSVVCFGKTAENVAKYCQKGKQLYIQGRLQTRKWTDSKTGADRYTTEIVANDVKFLGGGKGDSGGERNADQRQNANRPSGNPAPQEKNPFGGNDDGEGSAPVWSDGDIPF